MVKSRCAAAIPRIGWQAWSTLRCSPPIRLPPGRIPREVQFDSATCCASAATPRSTWPNWRTAATTGAGRGTVTFRVLRASDANVEVDTPSVSVRPSRQGSYRITVKDTGETEIISRAGDVEVFSPLGSQCSMPARPWKFVAPLPIPNFKSWRPLLRTIGTGGMTPRRRVDRAVSPVMWGRVCMAPRIWIPAVPGAVTPTTALSGGLQWALSGLPINVVAGFGRIGMVGRG